MMDIEKLVEQLHIAGAGNPGNIFDVAADGLEELRAELEQVKAERDAAVDEVKHLKAVMRDEGIEVIPPKYPWEKSEWNV